MEYGIWNMEYGFLYLISSIKFSSKMIATVVAVILILYFSFIIFYPTSFGMDGQQLFEIKEGSSLSDIADTLKEQQLIRSKYFFVLYVTALGEDRNLKAGKYYFDSPKVSMNQIVYILSQGLAENNDVQVTIPEGSNTWEIDNILAKTELINEGEFSKTAISNEGKLFPDTYRFKKDTTVGDIISRMLENYYSKVTGISNDKLIIASMLEKEGKSKEDMEIISGIIQKRLILKIPLQIDATVTYGACLREFNQNSQPCDVTFVGPAIEIKIDGPYNTYTRQELPAGPISNPGLKAINAALNPKETDYLYYLSTRDGSQIIYSKTPREHTANRRKYLGI